MYKPSTYLLIIYFLYLSIYIYIRPISYKSGYQGETKY